MIFGADGFIHSTELAPEEHHPQARLWRAVVSKAIMDYLAVWFPFEARRYIRFWMTDSWKDIDTDSFKQFVVCQREILADFFREGGVGRRLADDYDLLFLLERAEEAVSERDPSAVKNMTSRKFVQSVTQSGIRWKRKRKERNKKGG